ncbi:MAG TPA: chromosome segregation protein SMC [Pelomicrobium sp.]|nr:chromosome segregation protein SMC [Pelomicrobium sp.]
MRLAHLKLAGFKSFVDPTQIALPGDLVGVVGPNGCGKSNIIDAVRWVLGESRASALRGETMQDVIFNGSGERKPVARASVELVFDNSLGKAGGQWGQYAEISVKRVLERDGESSYYINNQHVRRRDVQDIFLGTGLGGRAYAIIEQGMISRIIEAKPEELRVFLEEAAGVSKYRERRRETELRLEDARENLARVDDIRQELDAQLTRLEDQARVAERYGELQRELHTTQAMLWLTRKQDAQNAQERHGREVQRLETELEAEIARLREAERRQEEARQQHYAASDAVHAAQGQLYEANAEAARLEQSLKHTRDSRSRVEQQMATHRHQLEGLRRQQDNSTEALTHWRHELEKALAQARERLARVEAEAGELPGLEQAYRDAQRGLAEAQKAVVMAEQGRQLEQAHRDHALRSLEQLAGRRARLEDEAAGLPAGDDPALPEKERDLADAEQSLARCHAEVEALAGDLPSYQGAVEEARQALQALQQTLTEAEARQAALKQLQAKLESNDRLSAWLGERGLGANARFWQALQVDPGWEDALEAVLRERLNAIALSSLGTAAGWGATPPGKLACYEPGSPPEATPAAGAMRALRSLVECRDPSAARAIDDWLADVYAAATLDEALAQRETLAPGQALVTPAGHLVTASTLTFYVPDSELHGVLAREREIEALGTRVAELQAARGEATARLEECRAALLAQEGDLEAARAAVMVGQQRRHAVQVEVLKLREAAQRVGERHRQIRQELDDIAAHEATETEHRSQAEQRLAALEQQGEGLRIALESVSGVCRAADQALAERRQAHQQGLQQHQESLYYEKLCNNKINELDGVLKNIAENLSEGENALRALERELEGLDPAPIEADLQQALASQQARSEALARVRDDLEAASAALRQVEQERLTAEQGIEPVRQKLGEVRLKEQEARLTVGQFDEQLREAGADEDALRAQLGKGTRPSALQADITRLQGEIEALGAVNLAALDELKASRERKSFLDAQSEDLRQAVETLENAIRRIDRETRERLLATYEQVNAHMADLFPSLFGGGQARLVLTGEEILDAGVQVIAQPPGKKNASIHLLSGGEKALTALSLVFAMFQLNPAPFCLLDEVDAPLDDTNTERFCQLVRRMAAQTQFVFISHNKLTMEMAGQLIGITMQEQGVSRVVAVDIEEAMRLREAAAA